MTYPVLSTYRLQLRGDAFRFADAEALLAISTISASRTYLSPILTAATGSDPRIRRHRPHHGFRRTGWPEGLSACPARQGPRYGSDRGHRPQPCRSRRPEREPLVVGCTPAWSRFGLRVLLRHRLGLGSRRTNRAARLGSDDDVADLTVDGDLLRLGDLAFRSPRAPAKGPAPRCTSASTTDWWAGATGCSDTGGSSPSPRWPGCARKTAVFDASHAEVARWFNEGIVDGVRIDHPDGLADPASYLVWLRELVGPDAWIVIEKILAVDEALEPTLPVAGTTGYDVLREVGGLFVDPHGEAALTELVDRSRDRYSPMPEMLAESKIRAATDTLASELARLRRSIVAATGADDPRLSDAVAALLTHIDVYRCDYLACRRCCPRHWLKPKRHNRIWHRRLPIVAAALAHGGEPATRTQQLCGAVTAKSVEDCLFYRDARLVSLNEVGGEPHDSGSAPPSSTRVPPLRARLWPPR